MAKATTGELQLDHHERCRYQKWPLLRTSEQQHQLLLVTTEPRPFLGVAHRLLRCTGGREAVGYARAVLTETILQTP